MVRRNAMQVPARRVDAEALPMPDLGFGELVPDTFVTSASVQRPQPYMINHSGTYIEDVRRENCLEKVMLALPTPEAILSWNPNVTHAKALMMAIAELLPVFNNRPADEINH